MTCKEYQIIFIQQTELEDIYLHVVVPTEKPNQNSILQTRGDNLFLSDLIIWEGKDKVWEWSGDNISVQINRLRPMSHLGHMISLFFTPQI